MSVFKRILTSFGLSSPASEEKLQAALEGFDHYSHQLLVAVDPQWDGSARMLNMEYCAFLYGAALAIVRDDGREDDDSAELLGPYLARYMDGQFSTGWLLNCEAELSRSPRLQGVQAAGRHTAQAVLLAGSRGQSEILSRPQNLQLLIEIFAEIHKLMNDRAASDDCLFAASGKLYHSVVRA